MHLVGVRAVNGAKPSPTSPPPTNTPASRSSAGNCLTACPPSSTSPPNTTAAGSCWAPTGSAWICSPPPWIKTARCTARHRRRPGHAAPTRCRRLGRSRPARPHRPAHRTSRPRALRTRQHQLGTQMNTIDILLWSSFPTSPSRSSSAAPSGATATTNSAGPPAPPSSTRPPCCAGPARCSTSVCCSCSSATSAGCSSPGRGPRPSV
jgi:hypothetical protein